MNDSCTIQLHADGAWHDIGVVTLFGTSDEGWRARAYTGYDVEWAVRHQLSRDAHAMTCRFPVGLEPLETPHWPVFLIDLLPQGFGRAELLRRLGLPETAEERADWPLLRAGAANSIGNLRIKEAVHWLAERQGPQQGFTDEEVAARGDAFSEYLATHGFFVAGSSGVQGEWPKLLLTRADDGLLYLDHTLPDERAREHYIVKFGRGANARLAQILRHEAPYMALAQRLGLRVHAPLALRDRSLFIRRFDRVHIDGRVVRFAQESIASLTDKAGFGVVPSHDEVCWHLVRQCTDPQAEVAEYLCRDVANLALGNKDNHARNTALQRDFDGRVALTPLYDFAPMYLHPDGIARRIRWEGNDGGQPDWGRVLDTVVRTSEPQAGEAHVALDRDALRARVSAMSPSLREIADHGVDLGLEHDVHAFLKPGLERLARELDALR
ncbi:type II toxin-antitoxin system HipA family toxin [Burkholderia contaminans]|uniref:type II toxin-antitoxin system HipA family toxin n=1 Tax=Burkholderia contaminans TaxID=488447 RepID=UPI000F55F335|nr:HipA domain-containing protein [Burkholderia contaminans]ELK6465292.1 type II toxin-antitoxin system HipA family toxin [Burkholderia contaminans]MBH9668715.1 type II toxin-antitoxin system HipA family toxin [Burkholderia contaminans]MBH9675699.1 type II toxin-antitoxin system HipA family toxin [Burkholderia contaminans]MBH9706123.1 type II toxin-antitoxin system HipA family toxin [Burkholderia contaminans]MBH9723271.1 type II toxin-antitoxin system HipA family toxin [Burkholderia contaminan